MPNGKRTKWKTRTKQPKTSATGNIFWLSLQTMLFNKITKNRCSRKYFLVKSFKQDYLTKSAKQTKQTKTC